MELGHGGAQVRDGEPGVSNGRPQVGCGEGAHAAIKPVGDGQSLRGGVSHHHHITLGEVDLEALHLLEAEEEELEVGDIRLRAFNHDDSVVSILEHGDPGATGEVGSNPTNMASGFRLIKDGRQRVDDHIEQEQGEGVALSDPTEGGEERADLTVYVHGRATASDHLHDTSNPPVVKALPKKDLPKEGPANRVVGFMKVNLQEDRLEVFGADLMEDFMKD